MVGEFEDANRVTPESVDIKRQEEEPTCLSCQLEKMVALVREVAVMDPH